MCCLRPHFWASLLPPDSMSSCPVALKPFASQASQGVVCPFPSYTASKLLCLALSQPGFGKQSISTIHSKVWRTTQLLFTFKATRGISSLTPSNWKSVEWEAMEDRGYFEPKDFYIALKGSCKASLRKGQDQQGRKKVWVSPASWLHSTSLPEKVNPGARIWGWCCSPRKRATQEQYPSSQA